MKNSIVQTLELGNMGNFIHIIVGDDKRSAMVIDPAWDADAINDCLHRNQLVLKGILLTHSHADHVSAVDDLLQQGNYPVYLSRTEFRLGLVRLKSPTFVEDGEILPLGNSCIEVIATPGHTTGSVCYLLDNQHLITGDTLFIDGCGRCNFLHSDVSAMYDSLQRLKQLPDSTIIYCGHHYGVEKTDTIGHQKQTNPYLLIDNKAFFIEFRMNLQAQYRSIPFQPSTHVEMQAIAEKHG